jgi:hypothetical protein
VTPSLTLRAGPDAARIVRERGLRAEDVDVVPGASGGPKWLVLAKLDEFLFGDFLQAERSRPLHLIGSSIGSWRLACLAQCDPAAALERARDAYIEQRYPVKPTPAEVTEASSRQLDVLLGATGTEEILSHPRARLHVLVTGCRGPAASERPWMQAAGLAFAAAGNLITRRALAAGMHRIVFHACGDDTPFRGLRDFPTVHAPLTAENLKPALLASASIPLVLSGVRVPGAEGVHRDGGIVDYHPDLDFGTGEGIVLYPHFYPHVVPGWFDRSLRWRRARPANLRRALLVAPSSDFVSRLPGGRIPDRKDYYRMRDDERIRAWRAVVSATERMADELRELIATGKVTERLEPI